MEDSDHQQDSCEETKVEDHHSHGEADCDLPNYCMPGLEPLDHEIQVCDPTVKDGLTKYVIYSVRVLIPFSLV